MTGKLLLIIAKFKMPKKILKRQNPMINITTLPTEGTFRPGSERVNKIGNLPFFVSVTVINSAKVVFLCVRGV